MGVGHAKLLLLGEHAAVYGHPAVGVSLPWSVQTTYTLSKDWQIVGAGPHARSVRTLIDRLEQLALESGWAPLRPGRLRIESDIPLASGFGSSGALCAALTNTFWPSRSLEDRDWMAWRAEGLFHGTPSGIDTSLALRTGWWHLDPSTHPVTASPLPDPKLNLVVGAVARESSTKQLVSDLARRCVDPGVRRTVDDLGALAAEAAHRFRLGTPQVEDLVSAARRGLANLGLETAALTRVLDTALAGGALAAKLSGAGGGGAFLALYPTAAAASLGAADLARSCGSAPWTVVPRPVGLLPALENPTRGT